MQGRKPVLLMISSKDRNLDFIQITLGFNSIFKINKHCGEQTNPMSVRNGLHTSNLQLLISSLSGEILDEIKGSKVKED
jgi:hypothetical protein